MVVRHCLLLMKMLFAELTWRAWSPRPFPGRGVGQGFYGLSLSLGFSNKKGESAAHLREARGGGVRKMVCTQPGCECCWRQSLSKCPGRPRLSRNEHPVQLLFSWDLQVHGAFLDDWRAPFSGGNVVGQPGECRDSCGLMLASWLLPVSWKAGMPVNFKPRV